MPQTPEAKAFLKRIKSLPKGPGVSLDAVLQPSLDDEAKLRKLFAMDKTNARLVDPFVGLVDVLDAPVDIRTTRARVVKDDQDLFGKFVMPLSEINRREEGSPCTVKDLQEFQKNWSIFTEGSLSQLSDWNNVVAAGGSVLGCLAPLPDAIKASNRSIRKHYHTVAYPTSDIDLFLWGLNAEQAEKKIIQIYEALRESVPWEVTCIRTKHTVSIHSQYPYRSIQIVLRLYSSPAEILAGFNIDAPCCLYNDGRHCTIVLDLVIDFHLGQRVFANPRAIVAIMRQANTVDMTRRSPSYEVRLSKYSSRGFEVYIPDLRRDDVDPTIYERSIARMEGMARLLVLERITDADVRYHFLESRRTLRGRPNPLQRYYKDRSKYKGDLKIKTVFGGLEMNDYDVATLHIPYGPGWNARKIDKLVYETDLRMNSPFAYKDEDPHLHRHPAFFGTMQEVLKDCCEHCPEPIDTTERALQKEQDKNHIRGRIAFIEENPGRQIMSGSFKPIDIGEWSAQVYIGEMEQFFDAIVSKDQERVAKILQNGIDLNRRDHIGRTALHVAILAGATNIACSLIDAGAIITAKLVDGRNALHLAAQYDQPAVIYKLFEKSASNEAAAEAAELLQVERLMDIDEPIIEHHSDDDWASVDDDVVSMDMDLDDADSGDDGRSRNNKRDTGKDKEARKLELVKKPTEGGGAASDKNEAQEFPEDFPDQPDVLDINLADWDLDFTPLAHAVMSGSLAVVDQLLKLGADLPGTTYGSASHPVMLTVLREDEEKACKILQRLITFGATTLTTNNRLLQTAFNQAVTSGKARLVVTILKYNPDADLMVNSPSLDCNAVCYPIVTAINRGHYSMFATLLTHGARLVFRPEDVSRDLENNPFTNHQYYFPHGSHTAVNSVFMPLETALAKNDDIAQLLIALGADIDIALKGSLGKKSTPETRRTVVDWVRCEINVLSTKIAALAHSPCPTESWAIPSVSGWNKFYAEYARKNREASEAMQTQQKCNIYDQEFLKEYQETKSFLMDIERLLGSKDAKTWNDIYPGWPVTFPKFYAQTQPSLGNRKKVTPTKYELLNDCYYYQENTPVAEHLVPVYDELFEACFTGYTPLFAAVMGRQWSTAKLIMAISIAQYSSKEVEKFSVSNSDVYDDDDSGSETFYDLDDSYDADTHKERKFTDIAKCPSSIRSSVHPRTILDAAKVDWIARDRDGKYAHCSGNLLFKAICDNDMDMFRTVLGLYLASPVKITMQRDPIDEILRRDRADMLDDQHWAIAQNDMDKTYLGLSIHGKKRIELTDWSHREASHSANHPLVWRAGIEKAKSIIKYLAGGRPLAAYESFAFNNGGERASQLRRTVDLEKVLPQWLGWTISSAGDSPLTSAILSMDLSTIKILFARNPKFMASCLHETIKFYGYNAMLLAVHMRCKPEIIDFLLAQSVSPATNDTVRGWNIYHIACNNNVPRLVDHLLRKLPRDVNEALLAQQSKGRRNTPLHLAVKRGATTIVQLLLDFTKTTIHTRDVDGSTPLHCAVQSSYGEIAKLLVKASPPEVVHAENGVGETPLEMASLKYTLQFTQSFTKERGADAATLIPVQNKRNPARVNPIDLEPEIRGLYDTIQWLVNDGKLDPDGVLVKELTGFANLMNNKVAVQKAVEAAKPIDIESPKVLMDQANEKLTLDVVSSAAAGNPGKRLLAHLIDVQKSVRGNLEESAQCPKTKKVEYWDGGLRLRNEESAETSEKSASLVLSKLLGIRPDRL